MSLLATEQRRSRRKKYRIQPKWSPLAKLLSADHPDQILTFHEWCRLNRISESTGRRILAGDSGPVVTELTPKRIGITVGANAVWQQSRKRA